MCPNQMTQESGKLPSPLMETYRRAPIAFTRGSGPYLYTESELRYLDFCAGVAVTNLGHCHPHLTNALAEQGSLLWHTSNLYRIPEQEKLAARLVAASFADVVFYCNSGAEAVEGGIKVIRKYQSAQGNPERWRIIVCSNAFHGRTLATLSAGGQPRHTEGFGPLPEGFDRVPLNDLAALRAAIRADTAGILLEPIQGDGGLQPANLEYLQAVRSVASEAGILLMLDEAQSGMGRTGRLFAHEWADIRPDVLSTAKGIAGGFPMGAVLATSQAASGMVPGSHGSTFGGNQLASAVGNAVLDVLLSPGFLEHVVEMGAYLQERVNHVIELFPEVYDSCRGRGLMLGIQCKLPNADVEKAFRENKLLTVTAANNVVRILPPLIIERRHIDEAVEKMLAASQALADQVQKVGNSV